MNEQTNFAEARRAAHDAFCRDDAAAVAEILDRHPQMKAMIDEPTGSFDSPAIVNVTSNAMLDVLLAAGANINAKSRWWAGGFGLLDNAPPELAAYAIERGAVLTPHAAARLGMLDDLRRLIEENSARVHERGGDGKLPLHFASTVEIAGYLLANGADIDAKDIDHESTAAQYLVASKPEIARYLVNRGAKTDLLMAAALGDLDLIQTILNADPAAIRTRVTEEFFPMIDGHAGGTIYQWELGWYVSAHQVAKKFGHEDCYRLLMDLSPLEEKITALCWLHLQPPPSPSGLALDAAQLAHAARNNDTQAVKLMLEAGFAVDGRSQHRATALHWASWHGNIEMVRMLIDRGASLDNADNQYRGTPLDWARHGQNNGWYAKTGSYTETIAALSGH